MKVRWFHSDGSCKVNSDWTEAEWGLPKGRRNKYETNLQVSKREFQEETGIDPNHITIHKGKPIIENYVANNGHHYNNVYYVSTWNSSTLLDL